MTEETKFHASMIAENWKIGFVMEYTLWKYLKENYQSLGFSHLLKKKKSEGGDFRMVLGNREVLVEVENNWFDYFVHKHHESEKFKHVDVLVCLHSGSYPSPKDFLKLPRIILFIAKRDFAEWIELIVNIWK